MRQVYIGPIGIAWSPISEASAKLEWDRVLILNSLVLPRGGCRLNTFLCWLGRLGTHHRKCPPGFLGSGLVSEGFPDKGVSPLSVYHWHLLVQWCPWGQWGGKKRVFFLSLYCLFLVIFLARMSVSCKMSFSLTWKACIFWFIVIFFKNVA